MYSLNRRSLNSVAEVHELVHEKKNEEQEAQNTPFGVRRPDTPRRYSPCKVCYVIPTTEA